MDRPFLCSDLSKETMSRYTFGKNEKLCSKLMMDELFKSGSSFKEYPLRVVHLPIKEMDVTAKVLISVPKKRFKKAVDRNRIKRLIRETYRLNKNELMEIWKQDTKYFALAFVYIGNEIPVYADLNETMKRVLHKLKSI
ncbi:MAG: ribonuclease P protein component [Flavobacteriales bacterium]|nr:ribonuclease P protein component [Flavobacteriales bacterium]